MESHLELLTRCVNDIKPRRGISYTGARLSDDRKNYELLFQINERNPAESVFIPLEMVVDAVMTRDRNAVINRIDAQHMLLFPAK